jgi:hypothetical protein
LTKRSALAALYLDARNLKSASNRRFQFYKRRQLFIRTHNETLSIVAMRVSNPDRSPVGIDSCDAAPTPTGFAEIVSDQLPVFHLHPRCCATQ